MAETEPPFTPEQIEWLDARYRKSMPQLERELEAEEDDDIEPAG